MLTKILFTIAVIAVVVLVFHARVRGAVRETSQAVAIAAARRKTNRIAAYCVIGVIVAGGGGFFFYNWRDDNAVITIRVISGSESEVATYQAYRKNIKGRTFTTIDGRSVTLGSSDRVEYSEPQ